MTVFILAIVSAFAISFLCSLFESTLLSVSTTDIAELSQKRPSAARAWQSFKENIHKPISAILILNTLAHTIGASVAGSQFPELFDPKFIPVFSIVFSFAMIQWTEILPKTMGVRHKRRFAPLMVLPLEILTKVLAPIVGFVNLLNRPFEGRKDIRKKIDASNEINLLTRFAAFNREINEDQGRIIAKSMAMSKTSVTEIMIPREEIQFFSTRMNLAEALIEAHIVHHTRFPLAEEGAIDRIIGYVNFKDIVTALQINPRDPTLRGIQRPILEVKPEESLTSLLTRLTRSYQHIAIVRSEEGRTEGLVTLEDLIEFIVGELEDEYDFLPQHCYQIADNRFIVGGGATLRNLNEKCASASLPSLDRSLHEWLTEKFVTPAVPERKFTENDLTFTVRKIRNGRIHEVIMDRATELPS